MKKTLKVFGIIIAIIAIICASIAILGIVLDISGKLMKGSIYSIFDFSLISLVISLPFTITELKNGIDIIKLTKKDAVNDTLKPTLGLVNSIVGVFAASTINGVIQIIRQGIENGGTLNLAELLPFLFGMVIVVLSRTTTSLLKRNSYGKIAFFGIFFSVLSFIYLFTLKLFSGQILDIIGNIFSFIVVFLVIIYCLLAIIYYFKNKDSIDTYDVASKDFDVIKEISSEKQKIRVYQQRKDKGSVAGFVFYILAFVFFIAFAYSYFAIKLGNNFVISFSAFDYAQALSAIDLALVFGLFLMLPYLFVGLIGFISKNSLYYQNGLMLASSIVIILFSSITGNVSIMVNLVKSFIEGNAGSISTPVLIFVSQFLNIGPWIVIFILLLIAKNHYKKLDDSIKNGESYYCNIKHAKSYATLYFVSSILILIGPLFNLIFTGFDISLIYTILFELFMLSLFIATLIHSKHPLEESYIAFKKNLPIKESEETVIDSTKSTEKIDEK